MNIVYGVFLFLIFCATSFAEGSGTTNLEMSGVITDASCNISLNNATQNIALGDIQAGFFSEQGKTSSPKAFTIILDDCSDSITGGSISFTGTSDSVDNNLIALTETGNQATGVAVQLLDQVNNQISINTTTTTYFLAPGNNVLQFHLRYKSTLTTVTPGDANAILYFDMNYE